ncbi:hypothetical protein VTO42DRAFT_2064 [Malbranchea cinnamomea]
MCWLLLSVAGHLILGQELSNNLHISTINTMTMHMSLIIRFPPWVPKKCHSILKPQRTSLLLLQAVPNSPMALQDAVPSLPGHRVTT